MDDKVCKQVLRSFVNVLHINVNVNVKMGLFGISIFGMLEHFIKEYFCVHTVFGIEVDITTLVNVKSLICHKDAGVCVLIFVVAYLYLCICIQVDIAALAPKVGYIRRMQLKCTSTIALI